MTVVKLNANKIGFLLALGVIGLAWAFWAIGFHSAQAPEIVRSRMHADLRADRLAECAGALDWLERHDRLTSEDWMVRARLEQLGGRLDDAIDSLTRVEDRDPLGSQARLMSGLIELERHRARPAEAALLKSIELDPGQTSARFEIARIYGRQQRLGNLDEQFGALSELNMLSFEQIRFWFMTRNAPWEAKDDIESLERMLKADPLDQWSRLALAEGLQRIGRRDEAEEMLQPVPDANPEARVIRARLAINQGSLDRAEQLLAEGPKNHPELAKFRGQLALKRVDGPAALSHFQQAYATKPDDPVTLMGLATALKLTGEPAAAEPFLAKLQRFHELTQLAGRISAANAATDGELHRQIGSICEAIGRRAEALAWYRLAITRNPLDDDAQRAIFRLRTATVLPAPR
jgi:tetratricopeptide (TPR) repeat protein